jgi:prolyl 4-hydroxylase
MRLFHPSYVLALVCVLVCSARGIRLQPGTFDVSPYSDSWGGYTIVIDNATKAQLDARNDDDDDGPDTWVEPLVIETDARVFLIHNLLTPEECDHIIQRAEPLLQRSTVVDGKGGGVIDPIRNSAGTFLHRRSDRVISKLNDRISKITRLPVSHQEDTQVLRYRPGEHYLPHVSHACVFICLCLLICLTLCGFSIQTDWFSTPVEKSAANGKQRFATILTYLNSYGEDYTGGETIMPLLPETQAQKNWTNVTSCTAGKLAVRPKKGSAIYFYNMNENNQELTSAMHGSCDVIDGIKYSVRCTGASWDVLSFNFSRAGACVSFLGSRMDSTASVSFRIAPTGVRRGLCRLPRQERQLWRLVSQGGV